MLSALSAVSTSESLFKTSIVTGTLHTALTASLLATGAWFSGPSTVIVTSAISSLPFASITL